MKIEDISNELITLLHKYLSGERVLPQLHKLGWDAITMFSNKEFSSTIPEEPCEPTFWHAIWQIQHLADESHEREGVTETALRDALAFLLNEKPLPEKFRGDRPL